MIFFYPRKSRGKKKTYIGFLNSALKFKMKMNFKEKMELKAFAQFFQQSTHFHTPSSGFSAASPAQSEFCGRGQARSSWRPAKNPKASPGAGQLATKGTGPQIDRKK